MNEDIVYSEKYDTYYNAKTNAWVEDKCDDPACEYCTNRPDKPLTRVEEVTDIEIEQYCDGWTVQVDGKRFSWDHNDSDMGTVAIKQLLEHLGHTVTLEECY
jgi:hypothetical protein